MGKDPVKKATTLLSNIGSGSPIGIFELLSVPVRTETGGATAIREGQDIASKGNVGNILKYINITLQAANRDTNVEPGDSGWLEWAVVALKEEGTPASINNSQIGVHTLGVVCSRLYRGNCLLTGVIPVGSIQPITQDIKIKLPKTMVKLQLGSTVFIATYFRSTDSTDMRTDSVRLVESTMYKLYM